MALGSQLLSSCSFLGHDLLDYKSKDRLTLLFFLLEPIGEPN